MRISEWIKNFNRLGDPVDPVIPSKKYDRIATYTRAINKLPFVLDAHALFV
jgi:hypothetical protein